VIGQHRWSTETDCWVGWNIRVICDRCPSLSHVHRTQWTVRWFHFVSLCFCYHCCLDLPLVSGWSSQVANEELWGGQRTQWLLMYHYLYDHNRKPLTYLYYLETVYVQWTKNCRHRKASAIVDDRLHNPFGCGSTSRQKWMKTVVCSIAYGSDKA